MKAGNTVDYLQKYSTKLQARKHIRQRPFRQRSKSSAVSSADEKFTVKWNDKSNIGPERDCFIARGTSDSMTVKDNGEMRKDLSTQYLIKNRDGNR